MSIKSDQTRGAEMKNLIDQIINEIADQVDDNHPHYMAECVRWARMKSRLTCRELGSFIGLTLSQVSDIEHGRLVLSEDAYTVIFGLCAYQIMVKRELEKHGELQQSHTG